MGPSYFDWPRCFLIGALQASLFLDTVVADRDTHLIHNFVTRPELRAPKWNVTVYDKERLSPGYIFVAPYERIGQKTPGDGWIGPHIYDATGDLVWSGADLFGNMSVQDFRISKVDGEDRMSLIRPELRAGALLNDHFEVTKEIPIEGFNMHDFNFIDDGSRALVILRGVRNSSREDAISTGLEEGTCGANFHGIAEFDTKTWEPTWNWTSWGHIGLNESKMAGGIATNRCSGEWDYLHANSVDKCPDGDIIMSGRHTDTIYKISRTTGEIVWRLGGLMNDFHMIDGLNFSRQHDARCRAQNETTMVITLLDNSKGEDGQRPTSEFSRGLRIAINEDTMEASLVQHFDHPAGPGGYSYRRGNHQILPNDNVLMGWSEHSLMTEHSPDGTKLMQAVMLPDWVGTYRSYKFDFVGRPRSPPDAFAQAFDMGDNATTTIMYISWNGATDVDSWQLYKCAQNGEGAMHIASKSKDAFETSMIYGGYAAYVYAEAMDSHGNPIGRSNVFETIQPANMLNPDVAKEQLWLQQVADGTLKQEDESTAIKISKLVDAHEAAAFAGGFAVCAMLSFMIFMIIRIRRNGMTGVRMPWHQQQVYQRIDEEDKTASRTTLSSF